MNLDKYQFEISENFTIYDFISKGHLGNVEKSIKFDKIDENIYNLGFGDKNPVTGEIDDTVVTNNGDMPKILATVASSIYVFTNNNPNVWIYVTGSSQSRIRLYRMAIGNNIELISKDFVIYTSLDGQEWNLFKPNTKNKLFLIRRKL